MKKKVLSVLLALVLVLSFSLVMVVPVAAIDGAVPDRTTAITATADRLVALQGTDGGWDWIVTDFTTHSASNSSANLYGVTALGLIDAYQETTTQSYLDAAGLVADKMISYITPEAFKAAGLGQSWDLRFLMAYAQTSSNTTCSDFAKAYWAWVKARVLPNAYADGSQEAFYQFYVQYSHGYAAWGTGDFGLAALAMGDTAWASDMATVLALHLNDIAADDEYRFIGWGKALEFLNAVDPVTYSNQIASLITKLTDSQNPDGSWLGTADQGTVQNTAYVVMGLAAVVERDAARRGANWLAANQISTGDSIGGWIETDSKEYSENDSEALQALASVPAPVTIDTKGYYTIQAAIDAANPGDTINVAAGTYDETVTIPAGKDNLTLLGEDRATTVITNGIKFNLSSDLSGVTISNFAVRGNAGTYGNGVTVGHTGTGYLRDVEFTNNLFEGQDTIGMCFYINYVAGTFSLINNEITGYTDWGTVYVGEDTLKAGSSGPSLSTVLFEGNHIHDNKGSSVVYGNADDFTDQFVVRNNEFVNNGGHEWFWATIEIDNVANLLVENNLFEGSPVGMEGVHGAGLYLTNDNDGLFSGSITWNQFINNWQGIYVFSGDVGGLSVHLNNFLGNDMGIEIGTEATVLGTLDATNNWWGNASGPQPPGTYESYGDKVSANVTYEPWLLESGGATYDKTLALKDGWTLVSTDKAVADSAWVGNVLALKYTTAFGEAFLADLAPLTAIYVKTVGGGGVGINYQDAAPEIYSKELGAGWNLIGTTSSAITANALLSQLRYTTVGTQQWVGLTTLVSQGDYNQFSDDFYLATLTDTDWDVLAQKTLKPFDGYWAYMEAAETFEVMP